MTAVAYESTTGLMTDVRGLRPLVISPTARGTGTAGSADYPVDFVDSPAEAAAALSDLREAVFLVDRAVARHHAPDLGPLLVHRPYLLIDAGEPAKTLEGAARVIDWMANIRATRRTTLVGVGGGTVQDLATFCAHVWRGGIPWVHVPTTLSAMADSCVGATCGINLGPTPDQLGVAHAPSRVFVAAGFLDTLDAVSLRSGYGEMLKLLLIGPGEDYDALRTAVAASGLRGPALPSLVRASLAVKQAVLEEDEDLSRILTYGETFGRALQATTGTAVPRGLVTAWGLDVANTVAVRRGVLDPQNAAEIHGFIARWLPLPVPLSPTPVDLVAAARRGAVASGEQPSLVLLQEPGALRIDPIGFDAELVDDVAAHLALPG